jgi:hypothetical protein
MRYTSRLRLALAWLLVLVMMPAAADTQTSPDAPPPQAPAAALEPAVPTDDPTAPARIEPLGRVVEEQTGADEEARASQERVNQLDDETQKLLSEYRRALAETDSHTTYAAQLAVQIESQIQEMDATQRQLQGIEDTSRAVAPLIQRMLETLEQFVALDIPFLSEERTKRVATLKEMMTRADVTVSEKYRRILESYQVEMDYGRTIEAYEGRLGDSRDSRTVQFLRLGRVALLYQTLDSKETGYWDAQQKSWVVDEKYRHSFKEGVAVAKKSRAPEMLIVPVPAPKEAKS